jgi:methyl-accepting chemotaxis protein
MQINSLDSLKGRKVLKEIYFDLKYKRFFKGIKLLYVLWKSCINKENITKYSSVEIEIAHSLGFFRGTALWMGEIFNRYYFSSLNAFVYFGAAILLILVGLRKFSELINDSIVIFGFVLEASMLVLMFVFMLFNPIDEELEETATDENLKQDEILSEIGEIARDFANATLHLEKISSNLNQIQDNQNFTLSAISAISTNLANATSPNPEMLESMKEINISLSKFQDNIQNLNTELNKMKLTQIETAIRNELGKIITAKMYNAE